MLPVMNKIKTYFCCLTCYLTLDYNYLSVSKLADIIAHVKYQPLNFASLLLILLRIYGSSYKCAPFETHMVPYVKFLVTMVSMLRGNNQMIKSTIKFSGKYVSIFRIKPTPQLNSICCSIAAVTITGT